MELKNIDEKLQILTTKALDLHDRIKEKINEHGFSFCGHCSNQGRYCVVADQSNPDEREKMIAIRDSLKELHDVIISLQKVRWSHERQRDEALARLEESRKLLIEMVNRVRCSEKEREKLDVLEEVIEFSLNFKWEMDDHEKKNVNGIYNFLVRTTRFGLELIVIFATIYTCVKLSKSRQQNRKDVMRRTDSDVHLDVLCGRG
ncbi:hypothetical protein C2S53_018603 [Perilla frutescens var. hirtella]|uniref:Uncharacterized protein n=1 Tax=Perilla frutescens var. hirtella TaxID=608512 RepID=A0AAD4P7T9_PERFH|nr:hypothetical protein C2S53_018603 [Perilla frutescens var. hirtella]